MQAFVSMFRSVRSSAYIAQCVAVASALTTKAVGDERGAMSIESVWTIAFTLIFLAILVPIGISQLNSTDTSGWDATQVTVWGLIGTIAILVIAYAMYKGVRGGRGGM